MKPSDAATYERVRRLANQALWTIDLKVRRLESSEPEDEKFVLRKWSDLHFLIVALTRLRRATYLSTKIPSINSDMRIALKTFDATLPHLKKMRDVAEHIDDYAVDGGKDRSINRKILEVGNSDGETWRWLGFDLNPRSALGASICLFEALRNCGALLSNFPAKTGEPTPTAPTSAAEQPSIHSH